jgi:hypothetical protein
VNAAEQLYRRIEREGLLVIKELVRDKVPEDTYLEYKQASGDTPGKPSANDLNNLAKSISAFSNTGGGVMIWGIKCKQGPTGDVPTKYKPLEKVNGFRSRLEGRIGRLAVPPPEGIENLIVISNEGDAGYMVTYIPQANHLPVRSLRQNQYYLRSGSSCEIMPHEILAAMFGRRPEPQLKLVYEPLKAKYTDESCVTFERIYFLQNTGISIARDVYLTLAVREDIGSACSIDFAPGSTEFRAFREGGGHKVTLMAVDTFRLVPGATVAVMRMAIRLKTPITRGLSINATYGCDGSRVHCFQFRKSQEFFREAWDTLLGGWDPVSAYTLNFQLYKDHHDTALQQLHDLAFETDIEIPVADTP